MLSCLVLVAVEKGPYKGNTASVPGTVQAKNFDEGGEGISYSSHFTLHYTLHQILHHICPPGEAPPGLGAQGAASNMDMKSKQGKNKQNEQQLIDFSQHVSTNVGFVHLLAMLIWRSLRSLHKRQINMARR